MSNTTDSVNWAAAATLMTLSVSLRCARDFSYYRSKTPRRMSPEKMLEICERLQSCCYSLQNLMMMPEEGFLPGVSDTGPDASDTGLVNPDVVEHGDNKDGNDSLKHDVMQDLDSDDLSLTQTSLRPFLFILGRAVHDNLETLHRELLFYPADQIADLIPWIDRERRYWRDYDSSNFYDETLLLKLDHEILATLQHIERGIQAFAS